MRETRREEGGNPRFPKPHGNFSKGFTKNEVNKEILLGTHNLHKIREILDLLSDLPITIRTLVDFPHISPVEEDGKTLEENAEKKAKFYSKSTGLLTLADDTGLEVAILKGEPGVRSARYAGENCSYEENNQKLLAKLSGMENGERLARFRCCLALFDPEKKDLRIVEGSIQGEIVRMVQGKNGFGYDPIFYLPQLKKTLAELSLEEKNRVSHRAIAILKAKEILR